MRSWIFAAFVGGAVFTPDLAAHAASFDCSKAAKPVEKIICAEKDISEADDRLARDYARLLAEIPAALKPALQKSQRSWLTYVPLACSSDGRGSIKDKAQFTQCLKNEYQQRIRTLASQPQKAGPFRTLALDEFQAMPSSSTDPDFFPVVTHVKSVTAVFGGDEANAAALNGWLQKLATADKAGWDDPETSASLTVALTSANAVTATAGITSEIFGVGAAHPLTLFSARHMLVASGKQLTFADMFQPKARGELNNLVWQALRKKLGNDMMIEKKADLAKLVADPNHWTFGPDGLNVNFNVYEVAAYVMGPQDVTIPWSALQNLLTPLGQTIANAAR